MTPPLAMLVKQVKRNFLNPKFASILERIKDEIRGALNQKKGLEVEKNFGEKFNLENTTNTIEKLNFTNYEEKIKNSDFSEEDKSKLLDYVKEKFVNKNRDTIDINPDFQIQLDNGKKILIEYKKSKKANQNKNQKLNIKLFMLFGDSKNIKSYSTIIGSNYGVDYQDLGHNIRTFSEKHLDEQGIRTKEDLKEFLSK